MGAMATVDYDPRRPEIIANPFPIFAELRERDPVHWSDVLGGWVLTRYRDVQRTKYVKRIHPIVHVTRIQPVVHVHKVTRVHTRIVGVPYPVHRHVTLWLPPRHTVTTSMVYLRPQCGCGY